MTTSTGPRAAGSSASTLFLLVAVALGVLATVLAFMFINQAGQAGGSGPKIRIVTAKRDLPVNTAIDPDRDLDVKEIPATFEGLAKLTLDPAGRGNYKGERVNRNIPAGGPVFLADIAAYGVLELKEPNRAMPIQAEPGIAIPGDYVKVLISRPDLGAAAAGGTDPNRTSYAATFAARGQAFRVLAVGGSMFKTRSQVMASESMGSPASAKVVTLEVTDAQAMEILAALGGGMQKATLVICPPPPAAETKPK